MSATLLDKENFTIPSQDRQIQEANAIINGNDASISIKINPEGDVWEYVSGVPSEFVGQQFFTYPAALRELQKVGKSLPADVTTLEEAIATMDAETDIQKYKKYLEHAGIKFSGCFSAESHVFDDVGKRAYYRLDDGNRLALSADTRSVARRDEHMGYIVKYI